MAEQILMQRNVEEEGRILESSLTQNKKIFFFLVVFSKRVFLDPFLAGLKKHPFLGDLYRAQL